ncbi:unknown [Sutterella wadsworthensis CAG:135]|nr:unknown [Sutterella wadsworthensis CAG:135]
MDFIACRDLFSQTVEKHSRMSIVAAFKGRCRADHQTFLVPRIDCERLLCHLTGLQKIGRIKCNGQVGELSPGVGVFRRKPHHVFKGDRRLT